MVDRYTGPIEYMDWKPLDRDYTPKEALKALEDAYQLIEGNTWCLENGKEPSIEGLKQAVSKITRARLALNPVGINIIKGLEPISRLTRRGYTHIADYNELQNKIRGDVASLADFGYHVRFTDEDLKIVNVSLMNLYDMTLDENAICHLEDLRYILNCWYTRETERRTHLD